MRLKTSPHIFYRFEEKLDGGVLFIYNRKYGSILVGDRILYYLIKYTNKGSVKKECVINHMVSEYNVSKEDVLSAINSAIDNKILIETVKIVTDINRINKFGTSTMALFNKEDMIYLPDIQKMLENERIVMKILKEKGIKYDGGLRGEFCQYHKFVEDELESLKSINLSSELDKKTVQCDAGITKIHIPSRGEVFPCVYLQFNNFLMGDLLKNSLREIWEGWDITRTLRNLGDTKCGDCKFLPFCKGGCPGMAYSYYGSIDAPDPRCIYEY